MKNIKMNTYQILIDEKYSRLLCVGVSIHVFDLKTMRKITRIGGFSYLSYASIDYSGDKLYALNTVGDLKVFNLKDFALVASVKTGVKDGRIVINGTKNEICVWGYDYKKEAVAVIELQTFSVKRFAVETRYDEMIARTDYELMRFEGEDFYLIESFCVTKKGKRKKLTNETVYGRYSFVDGKLINKEVIKKWNGVFVLGVESFDGGFCDAGAILYGDTVIKGKSLFKKEYIKFVKKYGDRFVIGTGRAVYEFSNDFQEKREIAVMPYLDDYCEFEGNRYIGSWDRLVVAKSSEDLTDHDFND